MLSIIGLCLKVVLAVLLLLIIIVIIRTFLVSSRASKLPTCKPDDTDYIHMNDEILRRFQDAIRFQTVSFDVRKANYEEMTKYVEYLVSAYPHVHSSPLVQRHVIANYSVLYVITGSDSSLHPYLFSTHIDVVPADPTNWVTDPFSGDIKDGYIYGRGTIDFKNGVNGVLEALEYALSNGFAPRRNFFVALGHDEEVYGRDGAAAIADFIINTLNVEQLEFVLDEGPHVLSGVMKGMDKPVAMVGVTEKGIVNLELSVHKDPGHSSLFLGETSIGILARAVHRLENTHFPSMLAVGSVDHAFFEAIAPQANLPLRMILSNVWLFEPIMSRVLSYKPSTNALIRTITIVTSFKAGVKNNVIPPNATAIVTHRVHNRQSVKEVLEFDRRTISDDRVKIRVVTSQEPHPISSYDDESFGFQTVRASIQQVFPGMLVAPGSMVAATDSKAYLPICSSIYRFALTVSTPVDLKRLHGINERISIKNYEQTINFYYHVMKNADEANLSHLYNEKHKEL